MSIATEVSRIQSARNSIRTKMVELGVAVSTDGIDALATKINTIVDRGAIDAEVKEGETYTIPAGYHNGEGIITATIGTGSVSVLASKGTVSNHSISVTPKYTNTAGYIAAHSTAVSGTAVTVSASELVSGNKALSPSDDAQTDIDVSGYSTASVSAITYSNAPTVTLGYGTLSASTSRGRYNAGTNNVTIGLGTGNNTLTAKASHILSGYRAIGTNSDGTAVASVSGSMTNNGAGSTTTLDSTTTSKTIAAGYWSSSNTVQISVATLAEVKQKLGLS